MIVNITGPHFDDWDILKLLLFIKWIYFMSTVEDSNELSM